jgi:hypothetical protein
MSIRQKRRDASLTPVHVLAPGHCYQAPLRRGQAKRARPTLYKSFTIDCLGAVITPLLGPMATERYELDRVGAIRSRGAVAGTEANIVPNLRRSATRLAAEFGRERGFTRQH